MPFVVDASVAGSWLLPDEKHQEAIEALEWLKDDEAFVPTLFWFEIRNLLLVSERRKRITAAQTAAALSALQAVSLRVDRQTDSDITLQLARDYGLTIYDATYLELATRLGMPLLTFDTQLITAARQSNVQSPF